MSCLMTVGLLALPILVWAINGNTTAHAKENPAPKAAKKSQGIGQLLLVRGKPRNEALQLALDSGAKEVVIALWGTPSMADPGTSGPETKPAVADSKKAPAIPVPVGIVEYRIINNRIVETELRIPLIQTDAGESIERVYNEVKAAGKIDPARTTKHKVFLTIPLGNKRGLNVEMQKPSSIARYPWFVRFRPADSVAKTGAGDSTVIAGIRIPVSVSTTAQLKAFLKPQWDLVQRIELLDAPISFGQNKVVRSERLTYAIAEGDETEAETKAADGAWGVRPGFLGKVECWISEKGQDYTTLMTFVNDIRRRVRPGGVVLSEKNIFIANIIANTAMPTTGVEGIISAAFAISNPKLHEEISRLRPETQDVLFARIKIDVGPGNEHIDTPATKPAEGKSDK